MHKMVTGALKPSGQASCGVCRMKLFQFQIFHLSDGLKATGHRVKEVDKRQKTQEDVRKKITTCSMHCDGSVFSL